MTFKDLGLSDPILHALDDLGFAAPMPIQEAVIPQLLAKQHDLVGLAQTGTGKTGAYGIPLIQLTDTTQKYTQSLVICPTRELCLQIAGDLTDFSKYVPDLHVLPVYGGTSIERQIQALKRGVQIIIATPGRLIDLCHRKAVKLDHVGSIVLDEADEMLNMGFSEDIDEIFSLIPENHSTLLFSATMSKEIERIAKKYLNNAQEIVIGSRNEGAEKVNHEYYLVHASDKYAALKRIVDFYPRIYAIVFCRTKLETQEVADKLVQDGYNAEPLHGDLSQAQRDMAMSKFRLHSTQLLVATDVAARGLDVDDLTHVINYGLPDDIESYTHRSGRTGRAGKKGTSISIVHLREQGKIRAIEKTIGKEFVKKALPTASEICTKQLFNAIDALERTIVDEEAIAPFLSEVFRKLDWMDKEDVIKRFVTMEFGRFLEYYAHAPQISEPETSRKNKEGKKNKEKKEDKRKNHSGMTGVAEPGYARFFIPIGKRDHLYPRELLGMLNKCCDRPVEVGRIDLLTHFAFFEIPEEQADYLEKVGQHLVFNGKPIHIERAEQAGKSAGSKKKKGAYRKNDDFRTDKKKRPFRKNKQSSY